MFLFGFKKQIIFIFFIACSMITSVHPLTKEEALAQLGLDDTATHEQITAAYRKLAKKYHPDLNQGKFQDMMSHINEAYDFLNESYQANLSALKAEQIEKLWQFSKNLEIYGQLLAVIGVASLVLSLQEMYNIYHAPENKDKTWHEIFTWKDYVAPSLGTLCTIGAIACMLKAAHIQKNIQASL